MNKTEELRNYLEETKQRLAEIEEQILNMENGDYDVFLLCGDGDTTAVQYGVARDVCDKYISRGRAFLTREEAEFQDECDKVFAELLRLGGKYYTRKDKLCKYRISFAYDGVKVVQWRRPLNTPEMWFDTNEDACRAIDTIGRERLEKYYFRLAV